MANAASDAVFAQLRLGAQFDSKRWKKHIDMFEEASAEAARRSENPRRQHRPAGSTLHVLLRAPAPLLPLGTAPPTLSLAMHAGAEVRRKADQAAAAAFAAEQPSEGEEEEEQEEEQEEGSEGEGSEQSGSEQEGSEAESDEEGEDAAERRAKKRKLRHGAAAAGGKAEEQDTDDEGIELFKGQREQRGAAGLASPAAAFVDHEPQVGASTWRAVSTTPARCGPLRQAGAMLGGLVAASDAA